MLKTLMYSPKFGRYLALALLVAVVLVPKIAVAQNTADGCTWIDAGMGGGWVCPDGGQPDLGLTDTQWAAWFYMLWVNLVLIGSMVIF